MDLQVTDWEWFDADDEYPDWVRGLSTLVINGTFMHLEAWAVYINDEGIQCAYDPFEEDFANLHLAVHGDGHFQTTTINGREYVLLATPFC